MSKSQTARKNRVAYKDDEETKVGKKVDKGSVEYIGRVIFAGAIKSHETAIMAIVNDKYMALLFEVEEMQKKILSIPPKKRDAIEQFCLDDHLNALTKDKLHEPFMELISSLNHTDDGPMPTAGWQVFWGYTDPVDAEVMRILLFYPPDTEKMPQQFCRPFRRRCNEAKDHDSTYVEIFDRNGALEVAFTEDDLEQVDEDEIAALD
jgi:hypothetical protein